MPGMTRRRVLAGSAVLPVAGVMEAHGDPGAAPNRFAPPVPGREVMRRRYFPDLLLTTHEGRQVRFYNDLLKDKIVVLNLMYARCTGACPLVTSNLVKVQRLLRERMGHDLFIYSLTVKPEEDTPEELKAYAAMHGTGPGWLFLTGKPDDVELLRHKLGFADINPAIDRDKSRHSGMLRYGNERLALWGSCQGQARPEWIVEEISFVMPRGAPTAATS
jgi:protein SCO1